jgi:hypothetical protein
MLLRHLVFLILAQIVAAQALAQSDLGRGASLRRTVGGDDFQLARATVDSMFRPELAQVNAASNKVNLHTVEETIDGLLATAKRSQNDKFFEAATILVADKLAVAGGSRKAGEADRLLQEWWSRDLDERDRPACAIQIIDAWGGWAAELIDNNAKIDALTRQIEWLARARRTLTEEELDIRRRSLGVREEARIDDLDLRAVAIRLPGSQATVAISARPLRPEECTELMESAQNTFTTNDRGSAMLSKPEVERLRNHRNLRAATRSELRLLASFIQLRRTPGETATTIELPAWIKSGTQFEVLGSRDGEFGRACLYIVSTPATNH